MANKQVDDIIEKFNSGTASEDEKKIVSDWLMFGKFPDSAYTPEEIAASLNKVKDRVLFKKRSKSMKLWRLGAIAASILILIGFGIVAYMTYGHKVPLETARQSTDIGPGSNKATLTLADGRMIDLSRAYDGKLAQQAGVTITKSTDGRLNYSFAHNETASNLYNTISTPRGGQYEVVLPDGTKVWLNAASSLRFPVSFKSRENRKVELSGEAYFEVFKDKTHPFLIVSKGQEVEVLGTHFNVNCYDDEQDTRTTLLEGSVKVNHVMLKPNEQAVLKDNKVEVIPIDPEKVIAWKNGKFVFSEESIENIMKMLSRWYNVEVVYNGDLGNTTFTGSISRYDNISKILEKITFTQAVHFKIEGRRIVVMP